MSTVKSAIQQYIVTTGHYNHQIPLDQACRSVHNRDDENDNDEDCHSHRQ